MDDRISDPWGERTPYGPGQEWPCASTTPPGRRAGALGAGGVAAALERGRDGHRGHRRPDRGWDDPESAFEAWKACSKGRPCDYGELSYERLRGGSGIQWGGERLYADGRFNIDPEVTETYEHELGTGASFTEEEE